MNANIAEIRVPVEVEYTPSWLTWVASATTCLRALGVECDAAEVAGMTGYAFHLGIARGLCPSGPTALDWGALLPGVQALGRSALVSHAASCDNPRESEAARAAHREAFELARREVEAGRPCVVWGTYLPEFGVVVGIRDDAYLVRSFKGCNGEEEPPIPWDGLQAPGGAYVLAFPAPAGLPPVEADHRALARAVATFRHAAPSPLYRYGTDGYTLWIEELESRRADAGGNSYNAACYAEGRRLAREFLARVAARTPLAVEEITRAAQDYATAAGAMSRVAALFPFPGAWGSPVEDEAAIHEAADALRLARETERRAIERLERVAGMDWPRPRRALA